MSDNQTTVGSVVGDVTRSIHDAWEFFLPATIRAFVALIIVAFLGGTSLLRRVFEGLAAALPTVELRGLADLLEKYKLAPLVPIVALFVLATLAYSFNRIVIAVSGLIPVSFTWSQTTLLLKRCPGRSVWYRMPNVDTPDGLVQAIEFRIAKARADGQQALLNGIDHWSKRQGEQFSQVDFAKFLIPWSLAWAIFIFHSHRSGTPPGILGRLLLLLVFIAGWACFNLLRAAYSIEQTIHAKITASLALLTFDGAAEPQPNDERKMTIDQRVEALRDRGWWWISLGSFTWLRTLNDIDTSQSIIQGIQFKRSRHK